MQIALYRLGRFAARKPWTVLGIWFAFSTLLVGASVVGGKAFEDEFSVPGLDSDKALVLLEDAQSVEAGINAQIVVAATDDGGGIADRTSAIEAVRAEFASLDDVVGVTPPQFSPDGSVALLRVLYRHVNELTVDSLEEL